MEARPKIETEIIAKNDSTPEETLSANDISRHEL